jgi:hypothetical protein
MKNHITISTSSIKCMEQDVSLKSDILRKLLNWREIKPEARCEPTANML